MNILFASTKEKSDSWFARLQPLLPRERFFDWPENNGGDIDVVMVAAHPAGALAGLPKLRLVQSLWMGVDDIVRDPDLPKGVPVARLVDPGMVAAMGETAIVCVLDWHRHLYRYRLSQKEKAWKPRRQFLACDRTIGVLGLGELGGTVAARLRAMGFHVAGWSRRPKALDGIYCSTDLDEVLHRSDAVICLLPLTPRTRGILNEDRLRKIRKGGCIVNLARGAHVVIPDLIAALDSGHLAHAYLDVFETEPLPADNPLWAHPGVTITPHVAALTEPRTCIGKVAENLERIRRGETPANTIDFNAGY